MAQDQPLCRTLHAKIGEQLELMDRLIEKMPDGQSDWTPPAHQSWSTGRLLGHLLDCLAGMCAALYAAHPEALGHFLEMRTLPVNHRCGPDEARDRIRQYGARIAEGFALLTDADLARAIPTVFVPAGEPLLALLLGNFEHILNHKHELFTHLKLAGAAVGTPDLYRFRG